MQNRNIIRAVLIILCGMVAFAPSVSAGVGSKSDSEGDRFWRMCRLWQDHNQLLAVSTELELYLNYSDDVSGRASAGRNCMAELKLIRTSLEKQATSEDCREAVQALLKFDMALIKLCTGLERQGSNEIKRACAEVDTQLNRFFKSPENTWFMKQIKNGFREKQRPAILKIAPTVADGEMLFKYMEFIDGVGKDGKACKVKRTPGADLLAFSKRKNKTMFEDCAGMVWSWCAACNSISEKGGDTESYVAVLEKRLFTGRYTPLIADGFEFWRGWAQMWGSEGGMSNSSNIPNAEYNRARWRLMEVLEAYRKEHPSDEWVRLQMLQLCILPNISRGACAYGNSAILTGGELFMGM